MLDSHGQTKAQKKLVEVQRRIRDQSVDWPAPEVSLCLWAVLYLPLGIMSQIDVQIRTGLEAQI